MEQTHETPIHEEFTNLRISPDQLRPYDGCLAGFVDDQVEVQGYVKLRTTFSNKSAARMIIVKYIVVNASSAHNLLLGHQVVRSNNCP